MSIASRFIESQNLRDRFFSQLQLIEAANPPAEKTGHTECCQSGVCCWRRPGCLAPEDVPKIAEYLGITEEELFKTKLAVDSIEGVTVLLPLRKHQSEHGGQMLPWRETYSIESPCTFFGDDNRCTIHEVKPHDCRAFKCWEHQQWQPLEFPTDGLKALGWDGRDSDDYEFED